MASFYSDNLNLENIQGVILDKDGTITDSHIYWAKLISIRANLILKKYFLEHSYYDYLVKSMGLNKTTNRLLPEGPIAIKSKIEVIENLINHLSKIFVKASKEELLTIFKEANKIFKPISKKYIYPLAHSIDFIKRIKKAEIKVSLVTSDTTENAINSMQLLKIEKYFDHILGGDLNIGDKITGQPALMACKKMSLNPTNVIAIGDAKMDFEMANNAGLKSAILVATGQTSINLLKEFTPNSINSLGELSINY